jgi:signal transduction histidine kinase
MKDFTLKELGLNDENIVLRLKSITQLAAQTLEASVSWISIFETDDVRGVRLAEFGVVERLPNGVAASLDGSICKYVYEYEAPLAISNLKVDDRTASIRFVKQDVLRSFIGVPVRAASGRVIGTLSCLHTESTEWEPLHFETLKLFADCVDELVRARTLEVERQRFKNKLQNVLDVQRGFIAHMSHEIRTPLTGVIGSIRLLDSMNLDGREGELIRLMNRTALRLLDVVNDSFDLAKLDAGEVSFVTQPCDLSSLALDVMDSHQELARNKSVKMSFTETLSGTQYMADPKMISFIINKLFENAIKFTQSGSAEIRINQDNSGQVVIRVIDTGIGICCERQKTIFEAFEQASPKKSRLNGGTGLGLALVERVVRLMSGEISMNSQVDKGTSVTVVLPLKSVI